MARASAWASSTSRVVGVDVLDQCELVFSSRTIVIDLREDDLHLAILEGVVEPWLTLSEDAEDDLVIHHRHISSDAVNSTLRALIGQIITLTATHHGSLDATCDSHVDIAAVNCMPIRTLGLQVALIDFHNSLPPILNVNLPPDAKAANRHLSPGCGSSWPLHTGSTHSHLRQHVL
jgi:hypothetical protein